MPAKPPIGCMIACGLLLIVTGLLLFMKAQAAEIQHTVIHDKLKPAYYTPFQAYCFSMFSFSLGALCLVVPFIRRHSIK